MPPSVEAAGRSFYSAAWAMLSGPGLGRGSEPEDPGGYLGGQEIRRAAMSPSASGRRIVEPVTEEDFWCAA